MQFWSVNYYRDRELVQWFSEKEMLAFQFKEQLYPPLYQHREKGREAEVSRHRDPGSHRILSRPRFLPKRRAH